jgi:hypothetical protein
MMMLRGLIVTIVFFSVIFICLILRDRTWYPERFDMKASISSSIFGSCSALSSFFVGVRFNPGFAKALLPDAHFREITLGSSLAMCGIGWISHVKSDSWQFIALFALIAVGISFLPPAKPKEVR